MGLFEDFILQEAVPRKAKELGISPDNPPDLTKSGAGDPNQDQQMADPNAGGAQAPAAPANIDPNAGMEDPNAAAPPPADPNAASPTDPGTDPNTAPPVDPNADPNAVPADDGSGGGEVPMEGDPNADPNADPGMGDEQDPNALQGPDGVGDDGTDPANELQQAEDEVYKDLKPEQKAIRDKELKERYQDFYKIVSESLDKLNKVTKTAYDAVMIDLALRQLLEIKDMTFTSITKLFSIRTYVENKIELQKLVTDFNAIVNTISNIYEARVKRYEKYNKGNNDETGMGKLDFTQDLGW